MAENTKLRTSVAADVGSLASELAAMAATPAAPLAVGTRIGEHFVIEGVLGRGGMGAVYRARDLRLDRDVAIKLGLAANGLARAKREATALARFAHPNVVTIHEIGEHDGQLFVAMELVTGGTARQWLAAEPRNWRAIVALYTDAGRGLAQAHAQGLIHRDVKPENLLVGADGRARVADFGLARAVGRVAAISGGGHDGRISQALLTESYLGGGGTPRYMAPEQRAGGEVDARSDQFALAVALYEALAGVHPFLGGRGQAPAVDRTAPPFGGADDRGQAPAGDARTLAAGRLAAPMRRVPRRIVKVVARALAAEPAARWPSVDSFVAALTRASRPRWPYAAVGVAVASAAVVALLGLTRHGEEVSVVAASASPGGCAALPIELDAVWTPAARRALLAGNPQATTSAAWLADIVEHYASLWPQVRRAACVTNLQDATWSPSLRDGAVDCLRDRERELVTAAAVTRKTAGQLVGVAKSLHDPTACVDVQKINQLLIRGPHPVNIDDVKRLVSETRAANDAGDARRADELGHAAVSAARRIGDPFGKAIALEVLGEIELQRHDLAPATEHLKAAYFEYRAMGDQSQTYRTALMVTQLAADDGKLDEADLWLGHARAEAERTGATPEKAIAVALVGANLLGERNQTDAAIALIDRTLPRIRDEPDPRYLPDYTYALATRAQLEADAGRRDAALATAQRALVVQERIYGSDHPELIEILRLVGKAEGELGRFDDGLASLARARAIAVAHLPADAPLRIGAEIDHARALGRSDPAGGLASLALAAAQDISRLDAETRKDLASARAELRARLRK